jgi:hypothetical protein
MSCEVSYYSMLVYGVRVIYDDFPRILKTFHLLENQYFQAYPPSPPTSKVSVFMHMCLNVSIVVICFKIVLLHHHINATDKFGV